MNLLAFEAVNLWHSGFSPLILTMLDVWGCPTETGCANQSPISTDLPYVPHKPKISCVAPHNHFSESEVFYILDHLQPTATGLDRIPAWFLRLIAPVFSAPIAQLFNRSIDTATVPAQWKRAFITPIVEVLNPTSAVDCRPISITPSVITHTREVYCSQIHLAGTVHTASMLQS